MIEGEIGKARGTATDGTVTAHGGTGIAVGGVRAEVNEIAVGGGGGALIMITCNLLQIYSKLETKLYF